MAYSNSTAANSYPFAFILYLISIAISPWPLGSNRDWAWPILTILIGLVLITCIYQHSHRRRGHNVGSLNLTQSAWLAISGFVALGLWIGLQLVGLPAHPLTLDTFSTHADLIKTLTYFAYFACTLLLVTSHNRCRVLAYVIILTGLLQALAGSAQQLIFDFSRASGSFANPNHFAGYLEMAICLAIGLMIAAQDESRINNDRPVLRFLAGPQGRLRAVIIIMVIALVMSRSRMGNIAFFTSIFVSGLLAFYFSRRFSRYTALLLISILAIDAFIIGNYFGLERLQERFRQAPIEQDTRLDLQRYNLEILRDHPWAGTGAGTYEVAFTPYRDQYITKRASHAENDYMELLVELGIIGCLPLLLILLAGLQVQTQWLKSDAYPFERGIAFGCLAGSLSLMIHGLADVNLQIPSNAILFTLLLAIPIAMQGQKRTRQPETEPGR